MKFVSGVLFLLLVLGLQTKHAPVDKFSESLDRDITNILSSEDASKHFKSLTKEVDNRSKERQLATAKYQHLKSKYSYLKQKYERLLLHYVTRGFLDKTVPLDHHKEFDVSGLPKKHARRLVKLKKKVQEHQRKMQDCEEHYHFVEGNDYDTTVHDDDSWVTSAAKRTAATFGIKNRFDAMAAGAGVGALAYGVHQKNKSFKTKREIGLEMQKIYVLKETEAKLLTRELKRLKTLNEMIDYASRRVSKTGDHICSAIDAKSIY